MLSDFSHLNVRFSLYFLKFTRDFTSRAQNLTVTSVLKGRKHVFQAALINKHVSWKGLQLTTEILLAADMINTACSQACALVFSPSTITLLCTGKLKMNAEG